MSKPSLEFPAAISAPTKRPEVGLPGVLAPLRRCRERGPQLRRQAAPRRLATKVGGDGGSLRVKTSGPGGSVSVPWDPVGSKTGGLLEGYTLYEH